MAITQMDYTGEGGGLDVLELVAAMNNGSIKTSDSSGNISGLTVGKYYLCVYTRGNSNIPKLVSGGNELYGIKISGNAIIYVGVIEATDTTLKFTGNGNNIYVAEMSYTGSGISIPENRTFTIAYGTPVVLNFDNSHYDFIALRSDAMSSSVIYDYIVSDGIRTTESDWTNNWYSNSPSKAGDNGGYEWSNNNKTLTLTMPRNYYGGTYTLRAM